MFNIAKNDYELDDSHYPFNPWAESGEGEFYTVKDYNSFKNKLPQEPDVVFTDMYLLDSAKIIHKRAVYNFLFVLADFGGLQLILTVIVSYLTGFANDRKSMSSILKKFFMIRSKNSDFLEHALEYADEPNIYLFKMKMSTKSIFCINFFSCFGCTPACSKNHRRYQKLEKEGEERLHKYVNARSIMGILDEHHRVLKKINTSDKKLSERIFDYILPLSSCDEKQEPSKDYKD